MPTGKPILLPLFCLFLLLLAVPAGAADRAGAGTPAKAAGMVFIHNGPEAPDDTRYAYHWRVLAAALEATRASYGPYTIRAADYMSESRQVVEMTRPQGIINTMVLDTTGVLEKSLLPVKIPVDKGLLGYRVFLIRAEDQPRYDAVGSLDELRRFSMGQGFDWSDVEIFKAARFSVVTGTSYEGLFSMLMARRFDAFGRGVTEVLPELTQRRAKLPGMAIEKSLLLYYPLPVYFWFPPTDDGTARARRVEDGMRQLIANGTLDKLFREEFGPVISALNLKNRRFFAIENPTLPPDQPFKDKRLWFDPLR